MQTTDRARQVVKDLFEAYLSDPGEMPAAFARRHAMASAGALVPLAPPQRVVADFIAGMTDRFAMREHERLTGLRLWDLHP